MAEPTDATPPQINKTVTPPKHHVIRTLIAGIFGSIAFYLIFLSIVVVWLNQTLTNTTVYVNTVAPLASQPAIQNFVSQKVTSQLMTVGSPQSLASSLLSPAQASQSPAQQTSEVQAIISSSVTQIVRSPVFAALWRSTNLSAHQQLIRELDSNASTISLDLHPAVLGVIAQLKTTKLAAISNQVQVPSNLGVISLSGSFIPKIHSYYSDFKTGTWVIVLVTLACIGICIWASVHHLKTLRRILMGTGILSLLLAALLKLPSAVLHGNAQGLQQQAILAVINTLLAQLFMACLVLGIVCIAAALGSKVYSVIHSKKAAKPSTSTETPKTDVPSPQTPQPVES
jgi:hypothetical protein